MPPFISLLDANVLYPAELRSFLLFIAGGLGTAPTAPTHVSAHLRTNATGQLPTLQALAQMILLASNQQWEEDR